MAEVTVQMIKELRDRTGVGMGKCKQALLETNGDMEEAIANLRKAGMASAVKKEGREIKEGTIASAETNDIVAIVEVGAETDFVVQNDTFQEFVKNIAEEVAATKPESVEALAQQKYSKDANITVEEYRSLIVQKIGENVQIKRLLLIPKNGESSLGVYSHMGGKILSVVEVKGGSDQSTLARDIAMHVAAAQPEYLSPETVPGDVIENEKDIARAQVQGKPDNIIDKIIDGKLNAFYKQSCLLKQQFVRDEDFSIEQLVEKQGKESGKELSVANFTCWKVGQSA